MWLYALLIGSVVDDIGGALGDTGKIRDIVNRLGGSEALEDSFITILFSFLAVTAAAMAISSTLRLYQEESTLRGETVLAGAVGRIRWAASHIVVAVAGTTVAMLGAGVVAGLTYGIAGGDVGGKLPAVIAVAALQLPAIWMLSAITIALFGLVPRLARSLGVYSSRSSRCICSGRSPGCRTGWSTCNRSRTRSGRRVNRSMPHR